MSREYGRPAHSSTGIPYEYVIVGGGIHGTCLANYLIETGGYTHDEIAIVDPHEQLLASFERKARHCGMETLRSTYVQHIDTEPFSLESFAEGAGRTGELVATDGYPARPTLDLFLDHARNVISRRSLDDCHSQLNVMDVTSHDDGLRVETLEEHLTTNRVVLAVGLGTGPTLPEWVQSLPADAPVDHVWGVDFDPGRAAQFDGRTYVVGGGITAAQVACHLADSTPVTLLSRHELVVELSEADPYWFNWDRIEREIHTLPPGSTARHDRIQAARNDGAIPPYVERRLQTAREIGTLDVRTGEISCAQMTADGLLLRFGDGTTAENAHVVLATGLDPIPDNPLVATIAESLSLERGVNGFPILDDRTLAWKRTDSTTSSVHVSGALAETTVGPFARNIVGARRVAERLLEFTHSEWQSEATQSTRECS